MENDNEKKVTWRSKSHSSCSMLKIGEYSKGMTQAEVEKEIVGTFGGKFQSFGGGKFVYVAYTD